MSSQMQIKGNQNATRLISYLKNAKDQYPPLDYHGERAIIEANAYDRDNLERLLFLHNIKLVFSMCKKYKYRVKDFDDTIHSAFLGLLKATERFDPWQQAIDYKTKEPKFEENGDPSFVKFATYAGQWIKKMILEQFYKKNVEVENLSVSLNAPSLGSSSSSKTDGRETATLEDFIQDHIYPLVQPPKSVSSQLSSNEQTKICKELFTKLEDDPTLSATDRAIFTDYVYNGESDNVCSKKYRCTKNEVKNLVSRILKKMKTSLETDYHIHSYYDLYSI